MNFFIDSRNTASEKETSQSHTANPKNSADDVEGQEFHVTHFSDAGYGRSKSPYNRHKARKNNGLGTMFLVKGMCFFNVTALKKEGIIFFKKLGPDPVADCIAGGIAQNSCDTQESDQIFNPQGLIENAQEAGSDQEGIAGQKKADQQTRFGEHNNKENRVSAPADQVLHIVKMREKFFKCFKHGLKLYRTKDKGQRTKQE